MAKKKQQSVSEDEEDVSSSDAGSDAQFVVEVIKAAMVEDGEWKYRVKWANYPSDDDTWEPAENVENCARLLRKFWEDIGVDDGDYFEGYVVKATPSWIKREKKIFAKQNKKKVAEESSEGDDEPMPSTSQARNRVRSKGKGAPPVIKKNSKGKAVAKQSTAPKRRGRPPKVKQEPVSDDPGDSDNAPLSSKRTKTKRRAKPVVTSSDADEDNVPPAKGKKPKQTIVIPPPGPAKTQPADPHLSDSAGSLFSEKSVSSPQQALKSLPTQATPAVPMKRPSVHDAAPQRTAKRQTLEMPMQITGTNGNATKARLAQRKPRPVAPAAPSVIPKMDLSKFSFKKSGATAAAPSPTQASPIVFSPTVLPLPRRSASASDHGQSPAPGGRGTPTLEPHSPAVMAPTPLPTEPSKRPPLTLPRHIKPPVKGPAADAEKFLASMMPPQMAEPMQEYVPEMPPPPVPVRSQAQAKPSLGRIQKKWKWTGDLFMDVSRDRAECICEVLLSEPTGPLPGGLRLDICLDCENIRLSAFHDLSSLHLFSLASTRVQQFAKLSPSADKDADAVKQLGAFMKRRSFFCIAHLYMEEVSVGLLIVYPTGHEISDKLLKVPAMLPSDTPLQVALLPWELKADEFRAATWKSRSPAIEHTLDPPFAEALEAAGRKVTTQRRFYQALHILSFPKLLYDFMSQTQSPRPYCIWNAPADTTLTGACGFETTLLKEILSTCTLAQNMGLKKDVRIVFVHVGALETLHGLPALALRRMKQHDLRFVTYGTHPSVPRERWGVREIYVLGGVVTFTPTAIIEGHWELFCRIKNIAEHPMWDCYVLPSVVAMVAKLTCQGQHPLRVYDEGNFVYEELLKAIEKGTIGLLQAPAITRDPASKADPSLLWTRWMLRLPSMNARQILEECLRVAAEQFAATSDADLPVAIQEEISRDMRRMQMQPVIMDNYRRFVVIKGESDACFSDDRFGIEATTLSRLDFKDDFFATPTGPTKK